MSKLVVVSNRVADFAVEGSASNGGLAMAMSSALRDHGGLWLGWSGEASTQVDPALHIGRHANVTLAHLDLPPQAVDEYYNGYANQTLWPLFHYRPDLATYERSFDAAYAQVNKSFARSLAPLVDKDDVIWVHDYHLIPLGQELRALGVKNRIGFFLHTPWPTSEVLAMLPHHRKLVEALFEYDLVGFQTRRWLRAFQDYVIEELGTDVEPGGWISAFGRRLLARFYPIGVDCSEMNALVKSDAAQKAYHDLRQRHGDQQIMIGIDRIDYTKGLPQKFAAYAQFLDDNPESRERSCLLQIGQPSRSEVEDYRELHEALNTEAGSINGMHGTLSWTPLVYRTQSLQRDTLAGLYRAARIALVTPLRDGMNLVAKEFVAAQDPEDPGVLILSKFAGAAEQMHEALLVNPFDREGFAEAIRRALDMPRSERAARWAALYTGTCRDDLSAWRDGFLSDLLTPAANEPGELHHAYQRMAS